MLASDLGRLARYAPINLMFTSSPLYPPAITPTKLPGSINLDLNTYEVWDGVDASTTYQDLPYLVNEESELFDTPFTADNQDVPFRSRARTCYLDWLQSVPCHDERPYYPADANLFVEAALRIGRFRPAAASEYEAVGFNYATEDDLAPGFLGFADDNWLDGTQSFVFNFVSPGVVDAGYGLTTTQIHEYGHHMMMSHPHDGFDYETGIDYEPERPLLPGVGRRRAQLDDELHRPELGLLAVRPRQREPVPGGRVHHERERDRRSTSCGAGRPTGRRRTSPTPTTQSARRSPHWPPTTIRPLSGGRARRTRASSRLRIVPTSRSGPATTAGRSSRR